MSKDEKFLMAMNTRYETILSVEEALSPPLPVTRVSRDETLFTLLRCLLNFGQHQLDFVTNELPMDEKNQPDPRFRLAQDFNEFANKIRCDLDIISSAIHQRTHETIVSNVNNLRYMSTLENADTYAAMLLAPAVHAGLIAPVTPITYYHPGFCARVIPYAPVALLGIPFAAATVPLDLALIAHEVGHYVYSRMQAPGPDVAEIPAWMRAWWEEIFADVYGCLVGGPATASALLELQYGLEIEDLLYDDGEYPIPILRPTICHATLQRMAHAAEKEGFIKEAAFLDERIALLEAERAARFAEASGWDRVTLHHGQNIRVTDLDDQLNRAVDILVSDRFLGQLLPPNCAMNLWNTAVDSNCIGSSVIGATATGRRQISAELVLEPNSAGAVMDHCGSFWYTEAGRTSPNPNLEAVNKCAVSHEEQFGWNLPWSAFFDAKSWATKGPGPGNPQPPVR